MGPDVDQHRDKPTRKRRRGHPRRHEPSPHPWFLMRCGNFMRLLVRLHEEHSFPARRAFGQVRQHLLLFARGGCAFHEHTDLVSIRMYPELETPVHPSPSLSGIGSPADFCSNLRRLMSTSLGSVPSASSAACPLRPRALSARSSCLRKRSVARFSLRLIVAS